MTARPRRPGFSYYLEDEKLDEYMALSPRDRLRWLRQAHAFLRKATPPENREIWEALLRGDPLPGEEYDP